MFAATEISATSRPDLLTGFDLHHHDRDLGELEELVQLGDRLYFVLDARHWSYGVRKLVPVVAIGHIDQAGNRALSRLAPDEIRGGPDFDPFQLTNQRYLAEVARYFASLPEPPAVQSAPEQGG